MKITCNRKEDILKRKAEWEADFDAKRARHEDQYAKYDEAVEAQMAALSDEIMAQIGQTSLPLVCNANRRFRGIEVIVDCASDLSRHSMRAPLKWSYKAQLTAEGGLKTETNSWSGMDVTTAEDVAMLKETARVLEVLINIDWATLLQAAKEKMPKYEDMVTEPNPDYRERPNFESELREAEIEDAIGKNVLLKGAAGESSAYRQGSTIYYLITKESPSQYTGYEIPAWKINNGENPADLVAAEKQYAPRRWKKANLLKHLDTPISTLEF